MACDVHVSCGRSAELEQIQDLVIVGHLSGRKRSHQPASGYGLDAIDAIRMVP